MHTPTFKSLAAFAAYIMDAEHRVPSRFGQTPSVVITFTSAAARDIYAAALDRFRTEDHNFQMHGVPFKLTVAAMQRYAPYIGRFERGRWSA